MDTLLSTKVGKGQEEKDEEYRPKTAIEPAKGRITCSFEVSKNQTRYKVKAVDTHSSAKN